MENGRFKTDSADDILDALMADAKEYFGEDLNDDEQAIVRTFYRPIAERMAITQEDIGLVLDSSQIDHAEGEALDLLTALIGIVRDPAEVATGNVTFSREDPASSDYVVQKGKTVQTSSDSPVEFKTTEQVTVKGPSTVDDTTTYSTSNTSYTAKTSFTVDVTHRDSVDVEAEFQTTNSSYTAYIEIADTTNSTAIESATTTNTSMTAVGPTSYDVGTLSGDLTIEYRIKIGNSSGTAEMTNASLTKGGQTGVKSPIEAVEPGARGNVGSNSITVMPNPPIGIDTVTNSAGTTGGSDVETDNHLRNRAKDELTQGTRASAPALYNSVKQLDGTQAVSVYVETSTTTTGLPGEGFEIVVAGGNDLEIAQEIFFTKAAGDTSYGGTHGTKVTKTVDIGNGQTYDLDFSRPTEVKIYVDADLEVTDEFGGIDAVQDNIVRYLGGILTTGQDIDGLDVGDNVIYGEVEYAIRDVEGVHDITNLEVDTDSTPTNTSNLSITDSEVATADGTDSSLDISSTQV